MSVGTLVHVAVGVIENASGEILIARRADEAHQGGLWEFPGGKVESGESVEEALARELNEELGIQPSAQTPLIVIEHDYGDKKVKLDVWRVTAFTGTAIGREGQPLQWVAVDQLADCDFPEANVPIIEALLKT